MAGSLEALGQLVWAAGLFVSQASSPQIKGSCWPSLIPASVIEPPLRLARPRNKKHHSASREVVTLAGVLQAPCKSNNHPAKQTPDHVILFWKIEYAKKVTTFVSGSRGSHGHRPSRRRRFTVPVHGDERSGSPSKFQRLETYHRRWRFQLQRLGFPIGPERPICGLYVDANRQLWAFILPIAAPVDPT